MKIRLPLFCLEFITLYTCVSNSVHYYVKVSIHDLLLDISCKYLLKKTFDCAPDARCSQSSYLVFDQQML